MFNSNTGSNKIREATSDRTIKIDGCVRLRIPKEGCAIETTPPISVPSLLQRAASEYPNQVAIKYKCDKKWKSFTYKEYEEFVRIVAKAFIHLGLQRHHSVCILGFNSPEWFIANFASIFAGGCSTGIYTTNSPEACLYCAEHSKANIIVVQDDNQAEKILKIKSQLPLLQAIVQYEGEPKYPDILSWEKLLQIGREQDDTLLEKRLNSIAVNDCCSLVFTSGTTGNPKAVLLSHDNLTWNALTIFQRFHFKMTEEVLISYLPLSHVAAQIVDIYLTTTCAGTIYFADKNALKGTLVNTLQEVKPTRFLAVPRVWEKIHEKMMQVAATGGPLKTSIAAWAKCHGLQHYLDKLNGIESNTWGYVLSKSLIFKRIRQALGFDRCQLFASAAAPLSPELKKYFMSIDILIFDAFGMSEVGGPHSICHNNAFGFDTIGAALPGMKTKIIEPDSNGCGEICLYGRHVFMGYAEEPVKTNETIDEDGWLHTGDIGYIDKKQMIHITGRLKELLITAGGENVAPVPIEQKVQTELPHVSNVILIGDQKKFLSLLLTLKVDVHPESGAPLDNLTKEVKNWLKTFNCTASTVTEILQNGIDENLKQAIQKAIDKVNQTATSNAQRIQKFTILPADFSISTGELGPTLKMRRNIIINKYQDIIDSLYV